MWEHLRNRVAFMLAGSAGMGAVFLAAFSIYDIQNAASSARSLHDKVVLGWSAQGDLLFAIEENERAFQACILTADAVSRLEYIKRVRQTDLSVDSLTENGALIKFGLNEARLVPAFAVRWREYQDTRDTIIRLASGQRRNEALALEAKAAGEFERAQALIQDLKALMGRDAAGAASATRRLFFRSLFERLGLLVLLTVFVGSVRHMMLARTAELKASEGRYRVIFECCPLPMWLLDTETLRFLAVNRECMAKYGYTEAEFLNMNTCQIRPAEDTEQLARYLATISDGKNFSRQARHMKKDGTVFPVDVVHRRVYWRGRRVYLTLVRDISERIKAECERDAMEVQLRHAQKLESIGQLASGIAHEINTPSQYVADNLHFLHDSFAQVKSLIELEQRLVPRLNAHEILRPAADEIREALDEADAAWLMNEIPRALEQAIDGVGRISTLVKAMKEFSHPGQRAKTLANLNHAIESTITVARNEWKYVADMVTDFDPSLPPVPCLVSDFNQVVLNLIVNAANAIADVSRDGAKGTIAIRTRRDGEWAEVRVEDSGTGIPERVRDRIFDPFFTTKEVGKGSGQGLAVARSVIVDKHCGSIHFETELGRGTAFIMRLPLDSVPDHATEELMAESTT